MAAVASTTEARSKQRSKSQIRGDAPPGGVARLPSHPCKGRVL